MKAQEEKAAAQKRNKIKETRDNADESPSSLTGFFMVTYMIHQSHNENLINEYILNFSCTQYICCHCDSFIKYTVYVRDKASIQDISDNILTFADHRIIMIMTAAHRH